MWCGLSSINKSLVYPNHTNSGNLKINKGSIPAKKDIDLYHHTAWYYKLLFDCQVKDTPASCLPAICRTIGCTGMAGGTVRPAPVGIRVWAWTTKTGSRPQVASTKWLMLGQHPTWRNKKTRKRNKSKNLNRWIEPWWMINDDLFFVKIFTTFFRLPPFIQAIEVPNSSASLVRSGPGPRYHNLQAWTVLTWVAPAPFENFGRNFFG